MQCRCGLPKTRLEHTIAATAINMIRLDAYWTGHPLDRTRTTQPVSPLPGGETGHGLGRPGGLERELQHALDPLESAPDVATGIAETARRLAEGYDNGQVACVLDTMTLAGAPEEVKAQAAGLARHWLGAMARAAVRAGFSEPEAARRARDALVRIQGALVVSRVLSDPAAFEQALAELPGLLIPGSAGHPRST